MADEPMNPDEERDVLAGELALGLLEGEELAVARRLMLSDRQFAERVRWWNHSLACMAERAGSIEPDKSLWPAIERRLGEGGVADFVAPEQTTRGSGTGLSGMGLLAALGGAAAAAAVVTLFLVSPQSTQPVPGPVKTQVASASRLVAQLQSEDGSITLAGLVEPEAGVLSLNIAGLQPGAGTAPELWAIPADGVPRSLGRIPESGSFNRDLNAEERSFFVEGTALAVTYEESGSIPHPAPTTEILVVGGLTSV